MSIKPSALLRMAPSKFELNGLYHGRPASGGSLAEYVAAK